MTSYDDTKVQLTINRMTEECYENVPNKSSTELYLISQDPTSIAKIDLDAQSRTDVEISSIQSDLNVLQQDLNGLSTEVSTLSEWTTTQIDDLIGDVQEVSSQTAQNAQDIADISANLTHSTVRRWEYVDYNGLTFTAEEANSTVAMQKVGSAPDVSLEYSTGDGWNDFIVGETTVTLPNIGDQMVVRAKTTNSRMGSGTSTYNKFVMTGKVAASDSIMYLLKSDGDLSSISQGSCFDHLFSGCSSLTTPPELPSTTVPTFCYNSLFLNCTSLTEAPELPATQMTRACYQNMFYNCSSLTEAPALPASLAEGCYWGMFANCTSLTTAPELPATTLQPDCYHYMFQGCTSLTTPPDLQATSLRPDCYNQMFSGCSSLTIAPSLNATSLANTCYFGMFFGCSSLATAPELPATTLSSQCYTSMFYGCTSLTTAPELPATTLGEYCYKRMFYNCSSLNSIKIGYTGNFSGTGVPIDAFNNWVNGVSASGTFYYDGEDTTTGASAIPTGWEVRGNTWPGLTFTAEEANSTLYLHKDTRAPVATFEYTTDGMTWQDFIPDTTNVTLANVGDKVAIRAKSSNAALADESANIHKFVMTGKIGASNSIMYLFEKDGDLDTMPSGGTSYMFYNCTSLTTPPDLPATTLGYRCYWSMFYGCTALTRAPELPATTLADDCYNNMFNGCTSLTTPPPELPATTLTSNCYYNMFRGCTSMTSAPVVKATTLADNCCREMFTGCSSITIVNLDTISTPAQDALVGMFKGSGITSISMKGLTSLGGGGLNTCFSNCVNLVSADIRNLERIDGSYGMGETFMGCSSLQTVNLSKFSYDQFGMYRTFRNCTSLDYVDFSQATSIPAIFNQADHEPFTGASDDFVVYVPDNLLTQWRAADKWNEIASHIQPASQMPT